MEFRRVLFRSPKNVLYLEWFERLDACQQLLRGEKELKHLRALIVLGMQAQQQRILWLKVFRLVPKYQVKWAEHATLHVYRMMLVVLGWERAGWVHEPRLRSFNNQLADLCAQAAAAVHKGQPLDRRVFPSRDGLIALLQQSLSAEGATDQALARQWSAALPLFNEFYDVLESLTQTDCLSRLSPENEPHAQSEMSAHQQDT